MSKKENKKALRKKAIITISSIVIALIIVIGICAFSIKSWSTHTINHLHTHLTAISSNNTLLNNKNVNGKYHIIFYMHNCPHCQHEVPRAYVYNKFSPRNIFSMHHIQYRDIASNIPNKTLATRVRVSPVPIRANITFHDGKVTHEHLTHNLDY